MNIPVPFETPTEDLAAQALAMANGHDPELIWNDPAKAATAYLNNYGLDLDGWSTFGGSKAFDLERLGPLTIQWRSPSDASTDNPQIFPRVTHIDGVELTRVLADNIMHPPLAEVRYIIATWSAAKRAKAKVNIPKNLPTLEPQR